MIDSESLVESIRCLCKCVCPALELCVHVDTSGEKSPGVVKSGESANYKSMFASGLQLLYIRSIPAIQI